MIIYDVFFHHGTAFDRDVTNLAGYSQQNMAKIRVAASKNVPNENRWPVKVDSEWIWSDTPPATDGTYMEERRNANR